MGMYTQIRGWLNVDSIGLDESFEEIQKRLHTAQDEFLNNKGRSWVCQNTVAMRGGNGSAYLFLGTELKNYDNDAENWIKYLLESFPNAEGRIDFQYEEDYISGTSKYWLIYRGSVTKEDRCETWTEGYGNRFE